MTWHVWTDGSCVHGVAQAPKRTPGWGGWAAVVEHGLDSLVVRGRVPKTTNVRMELRAAIEGLRTVPDGAVAVLHTDCTTIVSVFWEWRDGAVRRRGPDAALWQELALELDRIRATVKLLGKGERDPIHRRAHGFAGAEARAGLRNMPLNVVPLDDAHHLRKHLRKEITRRILVHLPECRPDACPSQCPVWLEHGGALVQSSRRKSEARRL